MSSAPSSANMIAAVLLPDPIPPVKPIVFTCASATLEVAGEEYPRPPLVGRGTPDLDAGVPPQMAARNTLESTLAALMLGGGAPESGPLPRQFSNPRRRYSGLIPNVSQMF